MPLPSYYLPRVNHYLLSLIGFACYEFYTNGVICMFSLVSGFCCTALCLCILSMLLHGSSWFFLKNSFFLVVLGLHCCVWAFLSCGERGLLFVGGVQASHCSGFSLQSTGSSHTGSVVAVLRLYSLGSVVVAHGSSCSMAYVIFLGQRLNTCVFHWQAFSYSLYH